MGRPKKKPQRWSLTVGTHGNRVTVLNRKAGGPLSIRYWIPASKDGTPGQWRWEALGHTDRKKGEASAREISASLHDGTLDAVTGRLSVAEMLTRYELDKSAHKKGQQPKEDRRRIAIWMQFLGGATQVASLDRPTMDRFVRERMAGKVQAVDEETGRAIKLAATPSARAAGADIVFLMSALNYACLCRRSNGKPMLAANPLKGYTVPQNKNVKRPLASYDRWLAIRATADRVDPQGLFGEFMAVIEGLGWRVSSVCSLRSSDIDRTKTPAMPYGSIHKRADADKEGADLWVPMSEPVRIAVDRVRELHIATHRPVLGDVPLFPAPKATTGTAAKSWSRWHARDLLERAEKAAGLTQLSGGDFHPYRRSWASARKHLPLTDVAAAGSWRDLRSLERCYTLPDTATILSVVSATTKVRDVKPAENSATA